MHNAKKLVSSKLKRFFGGNVDRIFCSRVRSIATASMSTDPASPCLRYSLIWYALQKGAIQSLLLNLLSSGMLNSSSYLLRFSCRIGPLTVSSLSSMDLTQRIKAFSTSGLVTAQGHFPDNAFGWDWTHFSNSSRSFNFCDSVGWVNSSAPVCKLLKCLTTWLWDVFGWESINEKTVSQSYNRLCRGGRSILAYWTIWHCHMWLLLVVWSQFRSWLASWWIYLRHNGSDARQV